MEFNNLYRLFSHAPLGFIPIGHKNLNAVVQMDIVFFAARAWNDFVFGVHLLKQIGLMYGFNVCFITRHWKYHLQAVHLKEIPRDNLCCMIQIGAERNDSFNLVLDGKFLIIIHEGEEYGLSRKQKAVVLPLLAVGGFDGIEGPIIPISHGLNILTDNT